jgi:hypothetical protein
MQNLNLLLKYQLAGDGEVHVKPATRISIDGLGSLLVYDAQSDSVETIELQQLQSFLIEPLIDGTQRSAPRTVYLN